GSASLATSPCSSKAEARTVTLGRDMPSASASSLSVRGPGELRDPRAAITATECSPSVSFLRRRTVLMRATRRLPATSVELAAGSANSLGILISLHNYRERREIQGPG